jgi:hypothetical protein
MHGKSLQLYDLDADPAQTTDLTHFFSKYRLNEDRQYVDASLEDIYLNLLVGFLGVYDSWRIDPGMRGTLGTSAAPLVTVNKMLQIQLKRPRRNSTLPTYLSPLIGLDLNLKGVNVCAIISCTNSNASKIQNN